MVQCPRCGNEAEYVAGEVFVLVWCGLCADLIEVGDLNLQPAPSTDVGALAATRWSSRDPDRWCISSPAGSGPGSDSTLR
jgi:hypothetical protein